MSINATLRLDFKPNTDELFTVRRCTPSWPSPFPSCRLVYRTFLIAGSLSLEWSDTSPSIEISRGHLEVSGLDASVSYRLDLPQGSFPSTLNDRPLQFQGFQDSSPMKKACVLKISVEYERPSKPETSPYVKAFAVPNNVCFHFSRTGQSLWANESILVKTSPYLSSLLTSGFTESSPTSHLDLGSPDSSPTAPLDFDDSDEEIDKALGPKPRKDSTTTAIATFKRVDVAQVTYTTYSSVLCWIGTGHISFAQLTSTKRSHLLQLSTSPLSDSRFPLPAPASPKSIFRLAHLLEIPELIDLSLVNFQSQLTVENVAYELYTDTASAYPQIRDAAMRFTVEHWKEVVRSEAYREVEKRAEQGEEVDALTSLLLNKKLMERWAK